MRETLISVGDCIMNILCGTSKLIMKKRTAYKYFTLGTTFFLSQSLDQCRGSVYLVLSTLKSTKAKNLKKLFVVCMLRDPDPDTYK